MKIFFRYITMLFFALLIASEALASPISIPASAFYSGPDGHGRPNKSGTAMDFHTVLFAPVSLPQNATITSFNCGGRATFRKSVIFTLRRNEPQQQNIDIASMRTSLDGTNFEFVGTRSINSGVINNANFNYYIVAEVDDPTKNPPTRSICGSQSNPKCSVGFCNIGFRKQGSVIGFTNKP